MNILIREFKSNLKSLVIWIVLLIVIVYLASFEF